MPTFHRTIRTISARPPGRAALHRLPLAALLLAAACGSPPPPPPPPPAVTVSAVVAREIEHSDEFTGRLQAVDAVEVRPRVSGYVRRVAFTEGSVVSRGDVLFEIDPRPYQAELNRAQAELQSARSRAGLAHSEVERARTLVARQAISGEEMDARLSAEREGQASIQAAEAMLETARLNLEWTKVRSPISGRIGRAEVTEGNLVQGGAPAATLLAHIVSIDPIYLYFDTDEHTYLKYAAPAAGTGAGWRDGSRVVRMALADDAGFAYEGRLDFVDNQLDPATGTIRARAVFANPRGVLAPGLFARVRLGTGERAPATLVRDAAVGTDQDRKFVLVLKGDGTVDYRTVRLGPLVDGLRVVSSGLAGGERVVVNGLQRVRPGMKVQAREEPMALPDTAAASLAALR
jgi:RND family efflux transporter MFP subunit